MLLYKYQALYVTSGFPGILICSFILGIVRRLGELASKLAEYGRGFVCEFTAGLDEFSSGLGESTLFNETLISRVLDLFKGPYGRHLRPPTPREKP